MVLNINESELELYRDSLDYSDGDEVASRAGRLGSSHFNASLGLPQRLRTLHKDSS